jgi:hypothetical protein
MHTTRPPNPFRVLAAALALAAVAPLQAQESVNVNLLQRYPTPLIAGDTAPARARPWEFSAADIFQVSGFTLDAAANLHIQAGASDLGIGHCADGVVWAVLVPRGQGALSSQAAPGEETIAHVWLRFHPAQINSLFPPETVSAPGDTNLLPLMRAIARHKFPSSFESGGRALIPAPNDMIVDADIREGPRRFFIVDRNARAASYAAAFERQNYKPHPALTPELAADAFDQLWGAFDEGYAMFILRPEINWARMRDQFRPRALASKSSDDFADVCAEMLKPLRDLHVRLSLAGTSVPVYDPPRPSNSNPSAHKAILGGLNISGRLQWAVTSDKIGFAAIYGWDDDALPEQFGRALEQMRDTRGLILDVRWNGGGNERLAQEVAGRFLTREVVYAYDQFRDGPASTNLTKKAPRKVQPAGPWRYSRPVILLMGQKCMSGNEAFIGMMAGAPNVTTMGDRTCGSSGNPQVVELPLSMTVTVPRWIDYKADGQPLDEHGYEPKVPFKPGPNAFAENRDDLLTAALERLRQAK